MDKALNQPLKGLVEPRAQSWQVATEAERRDYYTYVGKQAERALRRQLLRGKYGYGKSGKPFPRRQRPRSDHAAGPVLDPHGGRSRTVRLLTSRATANSVTLYWHTKWGTILGYHARGEVRGAPVRDPRLADDGIEEVRREGEKYWRRKPGKSASKPPPKVVPSPIKGVEVKKSLPRGLLKGPGLIDTRALKSRAEATARAQAQAEAARLKARAAAQARAEARAEAAARAALARAQTGPGTVSRDEIRAAVHGRGGSELDDIISALLRQRSVVAATAVQLHGMSAPERLHAIEFEGIRFHFAPITGTGAETQTVPPVVQVLRTLAEAPPIPREIARHTQNIFFTIQASKDDSYWQQEFENPGHVSLATGGGGQIVIYKNQAPTLGELAHELGHNWDDGLWMTAPNLVGRYKQAIRSGEPPVSAYAAHSDSEDFAEAVRVYVEDPDRLKQIAPQRHQAIEDMIRGTP